MTDLRVIPTQFVPSNRGCQAYETGELKPQDSIDLLSNPKREGNILLFGYTHRYSMTQRSPSMLFALEVIPQLAENGFKDLVLEIFPVGKDSSLIAKDLAEFNRTGKIGHEIKRFLPYLDFDGFMALLNQAHKHKIKIHAGGVNIGTDTSRANIEKAIDEVNANSIRVLTDMAKKGRRTVNFGGASHNDLTKLARSNDLSFGKQLSVEFPGKVSEIDLVVPEISDDGKLSKEIPLPAKCNWKSFIPENKTRLVAPEVTVPTFILFWSK